MNALSILLGFAENNAWANHRLHAACGQLSQPALRATRTSFFPSIHATLTHIVLVDQYYVAREDHVQVERVGDVLLHLFQHQIHHRGQAHSMLSGTSVKPPQLDELFLAEELPLREAELAMLGLRIR